MATRAKIDNPDLELMAHHDGELDADPEGLASDGARIKLDVLEQISTAIRVNHEAEIEDALAGGEPFAAMWSAIERRVTTNGESATDEVSASSPSPSKAAAEGSSEGRSLGARLGAWLERYRGHLTTGAVCAVAAAILVWFVRPPGKTVEYVEVRGDRGTSPATTTLASTPPELESLEVYDGSGVVLTISSESDDGAATTVIWLSPPDDEESTEGPI